MQVPKSLWVWMVVLGASARLLPHPWNFTPLMAIALFAGNKARSTHTGAAATLLALALSDAVLGFYHGFWIVYAASLIPVALGRLTRDRGAGAIAGGALVSSFSFFAITNFAVWASGRFYAHTAAGLATCYVAGLPFYQNELLGDACFTAAIFLGYAAIQRLGEPQLQAA